MKKHPNYLFFALAIISVSILLAISCKKDGNNNIISTSVPEVTTAATSNITTTTAVSGGTVVSDSGSAVTARGVCWGTSQNPTIAVNKTTDSTGLGSFTSNLTGLTASTTYYIRAYATNAKGTSYGNELSFLTKSVSIFAVQTTGIGIINATSAVGGGYVTADSGVAVTARGICWSVTANPTITDSHTTDGTGTGTFSSTITDLTDNTQYHIRAYAKDSMNTVYGNEVVFNTLNPLGIPCPGLETITIHHLAGAVAPVSKTVTYGTITNIPGEPTKCWITSNLGADHQATALNDHSEASAGWYWQFNRKQGYKHDGTTRTPNMPWNGSIIENFNWLPANDPCALELGNGWRLPTNSEWLNVFWVNGGNWMDWTGSWNTGLKLHAAGCLDYSNGSLRGLGSNGYYWSYAQPNTTLAWSLHFDSGSNGVYTYNKSYGFSVRCIRN